MQADSPDRLPLGLGFMTILLAGLAWVTPLIAPLLILFVGIAWMASRQRRNLTEIHARDCLDALPVQVWCLDPQGRVIFQNQRASADLGLSLEQSRGRPLMELDQNSNDNSPHRHAKTLEVMRTGQPLYGSLESRRDKNGQMVWGLVDKVPIKNRQGSVVAVVLSITDITAQRRAEEALRRSETQARKLALVASRTDNAVVITDGKGAIEWVNEGFERISGYKLDDARGKKPGSLLQGPGTDPATVARMSECIRKGIGFKGVILNYHRNGRSYWLDLDITPVWEAGELVNFVAIERDVTAAKAAELELRERMELAVLDSEIGIALTQRRPMRETLRHCAEVLVKHLGAALARIWTYDRIRQLLEVQASAGDSRSLDFPTQFRLGEGAVGKVARTRKPVASNEATASGLKAYAGYPLIVDDQLVGVLELFSLSPFSDPVVVTLASIADALALGVERERAVRERDQLVELLPDPMVSTDLSGHFRSVNPAHQALFGRPDGDSASLVDLVIADDRPILTRALHQLTVSRSPVSFELRMQSRENSLLWSRWSAMISPEMGVIYAVGHDITSRKLHEEEMARAKVAAERANRAKSAFLSRMSHELRTPLNAIIGFAQLVETSNLDEMQREAMEHILRGGRHLVQLINDVLDLSRVESGELALELIPLELASAIHEAVDLVRPLANSRGVTIDIDPGSSSGWVVADRRRVVQILLNLLGNAVKYNKEHGWVRVTVRAGQAGWRAEVEDTGPGIPGDQIPMLFRPFERLGAEHTVTEGTGLGLAVARTLIEAMRGHYGVESDLGQGSTFWFELPISPVLTIGPTPPSDHGDESVAKHVQGTILYIEDNPANSQLVSMTMARRPGIRLLQASTGADGVDQAKQNQPDLILLDLHLPDVDGEIVLQCLRQNDRTRSIPVLILSADATTTAIDRLRAAGANDYITKPVDIHRLWRIIDPYLTVNR